MFTTRKACDGWCVTNRNGHCCGVRTKSVACCECKGGSVVHRYRNVIFSGYVSHIFVDIQARGITGDCPAERNVASGCNSRIISGEHRDVWRCAYSDGQRGRGGRAEVILRDERVAGGCCNRAGGTATADFLRVRSGSDVEFCGVRSAEIKGCSCATHKRVIHYRKAIDSRRVTHSNGKGFCIRTKRTNGRKGVRGCNRWIHTKTCGARNNLTQARAC